MRLAAYPQVLYIRISDISRQVAGTPRPPSTLLVRDVHAVSAFRRRSAFFTVRLAFLLVGELAQVPHYPETRTPPGGYLHHA